jgi:LPXTG-motif cell wall-anchored protein
VRRLSVFTLLAAVAALVLAQTAFAQASQTYTTTLNTLNGSGASGNATVTVEGNQATVEIQSQGLTPGQPHAQHIHIGGQNVCPTAANDQNGDGFVSVPEGQPSYGEVQVALTTQGDVSADSGFAVERMPVADQNGNVSYSRTFALPEGVSPEQIAGGVIVQHGIDINGNGEYDFDANGASEAMPDLPFEGTVPATCGALAATGGMTDLPDTGGISPLTMALGGGLLLVAGGGVLFARTRRV